ncbi:hypothetical protein [Kineococcus sp. SYSU DK018]|uniref:hypothetical protein n=1 Tax=Kineococcus sp. SYSU DK018 TaxID=3383139 RepID=UPI003D7D3E67
MDRAVDLLSSRWGRVVGPGAGAVENLGSVGLGLAGAVLAPRSVRSPVRRSAAVDTVVRVLAADLWGGAWCNNTPAAVRWYHRPERGARQRLAFCAAHLHPFVLALLDGSHGGRSTHWRRAGAEYAYLVLAAVAVEGTPAAVRPVVGVVATAGGVVLDRALGASPSAPWFAPVYFTKLIAGHAAGGAWPATAGRNGQVRTVRQLDRTRSVRRDGRRPPGA